MGTLLKDLLYTRNNVSLDISRLSALLSVVLFWIGTGWKLVVHGDFDPIATGGGIAAIFAASAAWIHFRQRHEPPGGQADAGGDA
ncbi:hypothetical protein [Sphingomonas sp. VNH70]|uniref:hypothetical protein n=1 Tax=Sphingomonas silueang TaxID=3156617 RepID=UPI0032B4DE70